MTYLFMLNVEKDAQGRLLGFFGYEDGQKLSIAYSGSLPDNQSDLAACESLFYKFNVGWSYYANRPMSVGDVVALKRANQEMVFYAVDVVGFKKISPVDRTQIVAHEGISLRAQFILNQARRAAGLPEVDRFCNVIEKAESPQQKFSNTTDWDDHIKEMN